MCHGCVREAFIWGRTRGAGVSVYCMSDVVDRVTGLFSSMGHGRVYIKSRRSASYLVSGRTISSRLHSFSQQTCLRFNMKSSVLSLLAVASTASAHYTFPQLVAGGTTTGQWEYVRKVGYHSCLRLELSLLISFTDNKLPI